MVQSTKASRTCEMKGKQRGFLHFQNIDMAGLVPSWSSQGYNVWMTKFCVGGETSYSPPGVRVMGDQELQEIPTTNPSIEKGSQNGSLPSYPEKGGRGSQQL